MASPGLAVAIGYKAELERMELDLSELERSAFAPPLKAEAATKCLYRRYQYASLRGDLEPLGPLETSIDEAIARLGPAEDLCILKANLNFKLHRLTEAKRAIVMAPKLGGRAEARSLSAEIAFQEGRYEEARTAIESLLGEDERSWDNLARLAHMEGKMGDLQTADRLYAEAEDELTAKEMRSYAWVELQRGMLHAGAGDFDRAERHFMRADRAYPGFWLVEEHIAGLRAAQGGHDEAARLYERVLTQVKKPEVLQKLGEVYRTLAKDEHAACCFDEALQIYLRSAALGEVHYYHHLTEFYAAARLDAEECLRWARADIALRDNFATQAALAWALHLSRQSQESADVMARAIATGVQDGEIFHKAAVIYAAAGRHEEAHALSHKAEALGGAGHFHSHT